jgi:methylenetetrahydrofolate reductase (NADPH)
MRIDEIIAAKAAQGEPVFSFEFFPPKTPDGERHLAHALEDLTQLEPAFASVTYGAGGSTRERTIEIVKDIKQTHGVEAMAHLTCVGASKDDLGGVLEEIRGAGIENVLALRGDPPRGETEWKPHPGGLLYSTELAAMVAERHPDVAIGAACFPEVHPEAPDMAHDLRFLRAKVESGVSFLISQLFFDNRMYFDFVDEARAAGIDVPILPGIIPITNIPQLERITSLCGATIPEGLHQALGAYVDQPDRVLDLGVAYATLQCADLLERGAPGIHFYVLNKAPAARAILSALKLQRPWDNRFASDLTAPTLG